MPSTSKAQQKLMNIDATTGAPAFYGNGDTAEVTNSVSVHSHDFFQPLLGFHYAQAMENSNSTGTTTFYTNTAGQALRINLQM